MKSNRFCEKNIKDFEKHLSPYGRNVLYILLHHHRSGEYSTWSDKFSNTNFCQSSLQRRREERDSVLGFKLNLSPNNDINSADDKQLASRSSRSVPDETCIATSKIATRFIPKTGDTRKRTQDGRSPVRINGLDTIINSNHNISSQINEDNDTPNLVVSFPSDHTFYIDKYNENNVNPVASEISNVQENLSNKRSSREHKNDSKNASLVRDIVKRSKTIEKSKTNDTIQKYKKGVKSLLKNVDTAHSGNCDVVDNIFYNATPEKYEKLLVTTLTSDGNHKLKKVVQTQLINENGVMRYRKPKSSINSNLFNENNF